MDLAVQEKGVGAEKTRGQSKDDGKDGGSRTTDKAQHSSGNLVAGRCQSGENVVDEFASASVRVKVLSGLQVGLALDGSLVCLLADVGNLSIVVVVVVAIVVVVVVLVDLKARNALVFGNDRFLFVWKRGSVVEFLVDSTSGIRNATGVLKGGKEDALAVSSTSRSNVVLLVSVVATIAQGFRYQ